MTIAQTDPVSVVMKVMQVDPQPEHGIDHDHVLRAVFKDLALVPGVDADSRIMRQGHIHAQMTPETIKLMEADMRIQNVRVVRPRPGV